MLDFHDGLRVRHWVDHNSVKVYNEQNVLRIETTINMPDMFRVYRRAQGQPHTARKKLRPLRKMLRDTPWDAGRTDKHLSARVSRHLRLLRNHGLIRKLPNRHRCHLTDKGRQLTTALNAMLSASTEQLLDMAA